MSQTRQLAAIMFTDIVGYTALMGNDEQKAFTILTKNRSLQKSIIEQFNGRWIKELGDGVMASFNTVSDAVNAAIKIQQTCNTAKDFQLRIGIHLGEVVFENDDVFGDGVNIASRIQALATPGGVWISESVHNNVSNKNDINTEFVRVVHLKNVKEPVRIYQVKMEGIATIKPFISLTENKFFKYRKSVLFFIAAIIIITSGYFIYKSFQKPTKEITPSKIEEKIDRSIAVLPFVDMSAGKDQEYFSDGLSEELLNLLAKIPELKVIGRTSSFSFKGKNEDLRTIAEKLGVAHLLEGSVRKEGNKIRVTAQLIKATDGAHLWSETYERDLKDIFKLQDEISYAVVTQLKLKLFLVPSRKGADNTAAYNLILQGNYFYDRLDKDNVAKAVDFYTQALAIDSTDARTWGRLARAISRQAWQNYIDQKTGDEKARQTALKAISLDDKEPIGHMVLGAIKIYHDFDWTGGEKDYQIALNLGAENGDLLFNIGDLNFIIGQWEEAIRAMKRCIELDPLRPLSHLALGDILTHSGRPDEAIAHFKKVLELNPQFQRAHMYLGRNYILLGKPEMALQEIQQENLEVFRIFGLALTYHALGRNKEADETLNIFTEKFKNEWSYLVAELYAFRGEKNKALMWLEKAYLDKDEWLVFLKGDPLLKNLESEPEYIALLKKMNLPPN